MRVTVLSCLVAGVLASGAAGEPAVDAAKKCPRGKARVTIAGKTSCRPASAVLPRPKAIDDRLPDLRLGLLRSDFARAGAAGQEAQRRMLAALPQVLKAFDAHAQPRAIAAARSRRPEAAGAAAPCGLDSPEVASTNVQGLDVTVAQNGASMSFQFEGQTFRLRFASCPKSFSLPRCPSASGGIRSSSSRTLYAAQEIFRGNSLVSRTTTTITEQTRVEGKVADDARLDWLDVENARELFIVGSGGLVVRGTAVRRVRVDMRTGKYDPARSNLTLQGDSAKVTKEDEDSFAATVDEAIKAVRSVEKGWTSFDPGEEGYCATAVFSPRSETLKLKSGQSGGVGIYAKASTGGRATGARWTLLDQANARFTPSSARAPAPRISYRVNSKPSGGRVRVTVKFTSTAGVGKNTWTQPVGVALPRRITGSFSGKTGPNDAYSWSGTVEFVRDPDRSSPLWASYTAESVVFTVTFVVNEFGCTGRSESRAALGAQPGSTLMILQQPNARREHRYMIGLAVTAPPGRISTTCAGVTMPPRDWTAVAPFTTIPKSFYSDLKTFSGTNALPGAMSFTWSLRGSN